MAVLSLGRLKEQFSDLRVAAHLPQTWRYSRTEPPETSAWGWCNETWGGDAKRGDLSVDARDEWTGNIKHKKRTWTRTDWQRLTPWTHLFLSNLSMHSKGWMNCKTSSHWPSSTSCLKQKRFIFNKQVANGTTCLFLNVPQMCKLKWFFIETWPYNRNLHNYCGIFLIKLHRDKMRQPANGHFTLEGEIPECI